MRFNDLQLSKAVRFHTELNPAIWDGNDMRPEVREALLRMAEDFRAFINVDLVDVVDITISGSNAAYTYTPNSDIDLHLVAMIPSEHDQELRELLSAKKYQYNDIHDFKIRGFDVEFYVQDAEQPHHSMGIYSVKDGRWISQPEPQEANIDDASVKSKYECYRGRIKQALDDGDYDNLQRLWDSIKSMRKSGLESGGEFSPENLTFKLLRAEGELERLRDGIADAMDRNFSLQEKISESQLNEVAFLWPALAAAVRIGAPAVMRLLGQGAATTAKVAARNPKKAAVAAAAAASPSTTMQVLDTGAKIYNVVKDPKAAAAAAAKSVWGDIGEAAVDIAAMVGGQLTADTVKALATVAVKNALPIAGVIALLYGGKKLYDYMSSGSEATPSAVKEQVLDEVSMSPAALADFAKTDIAKSMTVGFEAEMAIEDMESDEDEYYDPEPDWDADEVVQFNRNWRDQVMRFFTRGDWGNTRRTVERALENIDEEYFEWISEKYQEWLDSDESAETITNLLKKYDPDISDDDIEDTITGKKNDYWGRIEDEVREDWDADNMNDDSFQEFMEYNDYDTMRGIYDRNNGVLDWPYMTEPERMGGGSTSYEDIESSFVQTTGYKATVSRGYHSAIRKPGVWIFEPDSSIEPSGVELVSPPMPLDEGLKALDDFFAWAQSYGAEANRSTGFHMGVSIPEQTMDNIDHLKLILFLGDEYVLGLFNRSSNSYAKSSLKRIKQTLKAGSMDPEKILDNFRKGLDSEAAKITRSLIVPKSDRYVSVNIKDNYIEFRSAGGNYFNKIPDIKNTMLRYVRAMAIAADPEAEKQEYGKKLYKLISTAFPEDDATIKYFTRYVAGGMTRAELKSLVQQAQKKRADKKNPQPQSQEPSSEPTASTGTEWEIYMLFSNQPVHRFRAPNFSTAWQQAGEWARANGYADRLERLGVRHPDNSTDAPVPGSTVDRAQQRAAAASSDSGPGTYRVHFLPPATVGSDVRSAEINANSRDDAVQIFRSTHPGYTLLTAQPAEEAAGTASTHAGYEIYVPSSAIVLARFNSSSPEEAERFAQGWLQRNGYTNVHTILRPSTAVVTESDSKEAKKSWPFIDGQLVVGKHFRDRLEDPDATRRVDPGFMISMIRKAALQYRKTLERSKEGTVFVIKRPGNPLGIVLLKNERPDGSKLYTLMTFHPALHIGGHEVILLVEDQSVSEGKRKPKKPKTIIDGAMKTLIARGRSEDEAIADLKKEIDKKFYTEDAAPAAQVNTAMPRRRRTHESTVRNRR